MVNQIGDGLGISANTGGSFIAMTAVSSAFAGLLAGQWMINLIVSYHERTYLRRDADVDGVREIPREREKKLRRPITRLNTPPQERDEDEEKSFMPSERSAPLRPFRAFMAGEGWRRGER